MHLLRCNFDRYGAGSPSPGVDACKFCFITGYFESSATIYSLQKQYVHLRKCCSACRLECTNEK